jgi:hypothetical protein
VDQNRTTAPRSLATSFASAQCEGKTLSAAHAEINPLTMGPEVWTNTSIENISDRYKMAIFVKW